MPIFENLAALSWNTSIASRVVTRASRSAKPESAEAQPTPDIFGPSSRASFAYFDRDTCCWKTSQATFLSDLEQYSETWPDSGTMRNGVVFERRTSEPPIFESASSSWPTTRSTSGGGNDRVDELGLDQQARGVLNWNTPHAPRKNDSDNSESTYLGRQVSSLQDLPIPDGPTLSESDQTLTPPLPSQSQTRLLSKRLNPRFVEWLMGLPIGWTEVE
jgi:hypothetical protein